VKTFIRHALTASLALPLASAAFASPGSTPAPSGSESPYVVGGSTADESQWPDIAFVDLDGGHCSGTLIAPNLVLTAAHCLSMGPAKDVTIGPADARETIAIADQSYNTILDVGLILLEKSSTVRPRPLAIGCAADALVNGDMAHIVGYGATSPDGGGAPGFNEADVEVFDATCTSDGDYGYLNYCTANEWLITRSAGTSSCFGDSGGPILAQRAFGSVVAGITSGGDGGDDPSEPCGTGSFGIYARADAVQAWIEENSGITLPEPTCDNRAPSVKGDTEISVSSGRAFDIEVAIDDVEGRSHELEIAQQPEHGSAEVVEGAIRYRSEDGYDGSDQLTVVVHDDGVPSLSAEVTYQLDVDSGDAGGCNSTDGLPAWWLALLLAPFFVNRKSRNA
jgi:hypothetical protein